MVQKSFGSTHTQTKLNTVFDYANFYTRVLQNKPSPASPFRLHYLDAFAGTGEIPVPLDMPLLANVVDSSEVIVGSVRRALSVEVPFSGYVFSDLKRKNVTELHDVVKEYSHLKDRIRIATGDANDIVRQFCRELGNRDRALIFLDPFGNQVRWETLEVIAKTRKVDLWYLFPAWLGVARQIKSNGIVLKDAEASIDQMFGSSDWRKEAVSSAASAQQDMFATESSESQKIATADGILVI